MKAIVQHRYGPASEVLSIAEVPRPEPGDRECLVRVHAASVHPDVWHGVNGWPFALRAMGSGVLRPKNPIPGMDVAGVVETTGAGVRSFKLGDAVYGPTAFMRWANGGAYAEYAVVPEHLLAAKPAHVTFEQAASVPTPGIITIINLRPERIKPGDHVLINGGGGNVGALAIQIAKSRGAHVTAVDKTHRLAAMGALGADRVIDYTRSDLAQNADRYDLVFDVATTLEPRDVERMLKPSGAYSIVGHDHFGKASGALLGSIPRMIRFMIRQSLKESGSVSVKLPPAAEVIEALRSDLDGGVITPNVTDTFSLEDVPAAMRALEAGSTIGRIVIVPARDRA